VNFYQFSFILNFFYLCVVENDILACLLPNCSSQLCSSFIFIFVFLNYCMLMGKVLEKIEKRYMQLFYYFTLTSEKGP